MVVSKKEKDDQDGSAKEDREMVVLRQMQTPKVCCANVTCTRRISFPPPPSLTRFLNRGVYHSSSSGLPVRNLAREKHAKG